jgi:hypothetical protein
MLHRQARLRAPYGDWYPAIRPDAWHHAAWVREVALAQLRKGGPRWQGEGRVLCEEHFEFQGGCGRRQSRQEARRLFPPLPDAG